MKINFDGIGHPALALRALRKRKVRDGSGWGRAGIKTITPGSLHVAVLQGSGESAREARRRLLSVVTSGGNPDWGRNWEIVQCHATDYSSAGPDYCWCSHN